MSVHTPAVDLLLLKRIAHDEATAITAGRASSDGTISDVSVPATERDRRTA